MRRHHFSSRPAFYALLLLAALPGCGLFDKPVQKPVAKPVKPHYSADEYVKNLSLANLDSANIDASQIDIIKTYHSQRSKLAAQKLTVALIDYSPKSGGKNFHSMAVISSSLSNADYPMLREVIARLDPSTMVIHDIKLASVKVSPDKSVSFTKNSAEQINEKIKVLQQRLIDSSQPLSFMNDAQLKLQLIDYCTRMRLREPAYLLVDNVKQMLATASEQKSINADILQNLSQRLETLEGTLHKELPFTL